MNNKIFVTKPIDIDPNIFENQLERLYKAALHSPDDVYDILKEIVPNYNNVENNDSFYQVKKIVGEESML